MCNWRNGDFEFFLSPRFVEDAIWHMPSKALILRANVLRPSQLYEVRNQMGGLHQLFTGPEGWSAIESDRDPTFVEADEKSVLFNIEFPLLVLGPQLFALSLMAEGKLAQELMEGGSEQIYQPEASEKVRGQGHGSRSLESAQPASPNFAVRGTSTVIFVMEF